MTVGFIGCNDTAAILARGWDDRMVCADADPARAIELAAASGGAALDDYGAVARHADVVLLCHAPAALRGIAEVVAPHAPIVVSTLEKTPLEAARGAYPRQPVYRIAVNPAAAIQRGVVLLAEASSHDADEAVRSLLGRLGRVIVLDDALIDAAASVMRGTAADVEARAADPGARAALERFAKLMNVSH